MRNTQPQDPANRRRYPGPRSAPLATHRRQKSCVSKGAPRATARTPKIAYARATGRRTPCTTHMATDQYSDGATEVHPPKAATRSTAMYIYSQTSRSSGLGSHPPACRGWDRTICTADIRGIPDGYPATVNAQKYRVGGTALADSCHGTAAALTRSDADPP